MSTCVSNISSQWGICTNMQKTPFWPCSSGTSFFHIRASGAGGLASYHVVRSPCSHFQTIWNTSHCYGFVYFSKYINHSAGSREIHL